MKKIFIIICGILVMGDAAAAPSHYQEPKEVFYVPNNQDSWKAYNDGEYNKPLDNSLYTKLGTQLNKVSATNHGTHDDEAAVVLIMARDIYTNGNGGYFCMTQVQAANQNGRRYTWIDYYDYPGKYKCEELCRKGYWGTGCTKTGTPDSCHTDKLDFGDYTLKTSGERNTQITNKTNVFVEDNAQGTSTTTADHRILIVTKKMDHGVIVSPVEVTAERYQSGTGNGKYSWIKSVNSNGQEFLLCAQGYEPNASGTDCQEPSWCRQQQDFDKLCPEFSTSDYKSEQHKIVNDATRGCNVIRCDYSNYGFKTKNDLDCMECTGGALAYIDADGLCNECPKGQYPNESGNGCMPENKLDQYSKVDMQSKNGRQCWLETTPERFAGCVNGCSGSTECWKDGKCAVCD